MRKNMRLGILFIVMFILVMYFGNEGKGFENINNDSLKFISTYLDSFQKYLFTITIFISLTIAFVQIPFLNSEIRIRIKTKMFEYVWSKYLTIIFMTSIYLLLVFFSVSFIFGYDNIFRIFSFPIFFRLFSFIMSCFVLFTFIYSVSHNQILSVSVVIFSNFMLLIFVNSINFYLTNNTITDVIMMKILSFYSGLINFFGIAYLYFRMDKKECLK